jgi:hypothetical protein
MAGLYFFWQQDNVPIVPPTPPGPIRLRGTISMAARSSGGAMGGTSLAGNISIGSRMSERIDIEEEG